MHGRRCRADLGHCLVVDDPLRLVRIERAGVDVCTIGLCFGERLGIPLVSKGFGFSDERALAW